jgi:DNA polymerase III epsilon subunit-like protein
MSLPKHILIFDTETTGLIPKSNDIPNPHITQLSFIVYDTQLNKIRTTFDSYIQLPKGVEVPQIVTELTGITNEKCEQGMPIQQALGIFYHTMILCDCIIAHNIDFDIRMIIIEVQRNIESLQFYPNIENIFAYNRLHPLNIQLDCTMQMSTEACCIYRTNERNKTYKKFPKLSETYFHLFGKVPENLHNSMIDALVCLRCYLKMKFNMDMDDNDYQYLLDAAL